jgi:NAD(P)H dehydrogenase (quinone)
MKTLITGASGKFGGTASRKPEKLAEYAQLGCTVRFADFDKPESLAAAAQGAEQMLLISGHKVGHRIKQHGHAISAAKQADAD